MAKMQMSLLLRAACLACLAIVATCFEHTEMYDRLGISPDADARKIKRAFRKLSLKWHPDKNKNSEEAQAKFKEISEAYEILSDEDKRSAYDLDGLEGLKKKEQGGGGMSPFDMFFGGGGRQQRRGPDASVTLPVTLEDLYNGGQRSARISRNIICKACRGTGAKDGKLKKCKKCGGKGVRLVQQQMGPGFTVQMQQPCGKCNGRGTMPAKACKVCGGKKVIMEEKTLTADIERGMPSNHEIVFERESEQQPGITPGNVVFKLQQKPHPRFKRNGDDLHHDMHITLKEALLGFEKTVKQLDGTDVVVEQKDRVSRPFQVLLLKEEGMPKHNFPSESGDMHVKLHIDMPRKLTSAQKKLVEELLG